MAVLRGGTTIGGYLALHSGMANAYMNGIFTALKVRAAVYNDYAEFRRSKYNIFPGRIAVECGNGYVTLSSKRLQKTAMVISDTYGFILGEQAFDGEYCVPIAVAGRALTYTDKNRSKFKIGDVVCAGKNGTVSKMKWYEKILFPDRILGIVSEIPMYEVWGTSNVLVDGRIWVRVK